MDDRAAGRALHRAQEALTYAFDQARFTGYRSGSREVHDLEQAEAHYQHALRLVHPTHSRSPDPFAPSREGPDGEAPGAPEAQLQAATEPGDRPGARRAP